jgi:hypothetical protein
MCSDHPEFRMKLQTISVMRTRAYDVWRAGWGGTRKFARQRSLFRQFSAIE